MPTVKSDDIQVQAQRPLVNTPNVPAGAFGQGLVRGAQQAVNDINYVGQKMKRADDFAAVTEANLNFRQGLNELGHGKNGFFNQVGSSANYEARDNYLKAVKELQRDAAQHLTPGVQQRDYMGTSGQYVVREEETSSAYTANQRKNHLAAVTEKGIDQSVDDLALNLDRPDIYIAQITKGVLEQSEQNGFNINNKEDRVVIEVALQTKLTAAHLNSIEVMLAADQTEAAKVYVEKYGHQMNEKARVKAEEQVKSDNDLLVAQKTADQFRGTDLNAKERLDAVAEADLSPEERALTEQRIKNDVAVEKAANLEETNKAAMDALEFMSQNPELTWQDIKKSMPKMYPRFSDTQRKAIMQGAGSLRPDIPSQVILVKGMIADPETSTDEILDHLQKNVTSFSDSTFQNLGSESLKSAPVYRTETPAKTFTDRTLEYLGPMPGSSAPNSVKAWKQRKRILLGYYDELAAEWHDANRGKQIPPRENEELMARVFYTYAKEEEQFFGLFTTDSEYELSDIPNSQLSLIEGDIKALNKKIGAVPGDENYIPVSPQNIIQTWQMTK